MPDRPCAGVAPGTVNGSGVAPAGAGTTGAPPMAGMPVTVHPVDGAGGPATGPGAG